MKYKIKILSALDINLESTSTSYLFAKFRCDTDFIPLYLFARNNEANFPYSETFESNDLLYFQALNDRLILSNLNDTNALLGCDQDFVQFLVPRLLKRPISPANAIHSHDPDTISVIPQYEFVGFDFERLFRYLDRVESLNLATSSTFYINNTYGPDPLEDDNKHDNGFTFNNPDLLLLAVLVPA